MQKILVLFMALAAVGLGAKPGPDATLNAGHSLGDGFAYILFNEGTGTPVDYAGNYTLTPVNSPVWTTGEYGAAIDLEDDDDDHYTLNGTFGSGTDITVIVVCKSESNPAYVGILGKSESDIGVRLRSGQGEFDGQLNTRTTLLSTGTYYMLSYVREGSVVRGYIDGTLDVTGSSSETSYSFDYLGAQYFSTRNFDGEIVLLYIYKRALTESEVASIYSDPYQMFTEPVGDNNHIFLRKTNNGGKQ